MTKSGYSGFHRFMTLKITEKNIWIVKKHLI